jgi:DNA transformation protein and related proteins
MDNDHLHDLFSSFGPVTIKKMFGGKGIYADGLIIALELSIGELFLKADDQSSTEFSAAGCSQWVYEGHGKNVAMPYWSVPESAFDDSDEMALWARKALEASRRAAAKAKPKSPRVKKPKA